MTLALFAWAVVGCFASTEEFPPEDAVNIRIRNETGEDIDKFWLGAGSQGGSTGNTAFGSIRNNQNSNYHQIQPVLANYRKCNFLIDGTRYLDNIDPTEHIGADQLLTGKFYTFVYEIVGGEPQLTIIEETAP